MKRFFSLVQQFSKPLLVAVGILLYIALGYGLKQTNVSLLIAWIAILIGTFDLIKETITAIRSRQFVLDYIAMLAIILSIVLGQYVIALVIVLMLSTGTTLEQYGLARAKKSLTALVDRMPSEVLVVDNNGVTQKQLIGRVPIGSVILIRKGEVVPLDGVLNDSAGLFDESSLTGEPYLIDKVSGDIVRSGTINLGNAIRVTVTKSDAESTYRQIITLVQAAQEERPPLIRLADHYSVIFTVITFALSGVAFFLTHDWQRVLAVLVVATPCPLILATPIALFGGLNAAARRRIVVKTMGSLEVLARVDTLIFDKTGTITLGQPSIVDVRILQTTYTVRDVYAIAEALERNSLHPLAKALVAAAHRVGAPRLHAEKIEEKIGSGITAVLQGTSYTLSKARDEESGLVIELKTADQLIAQFVFADQLKTDSVGSLSKLQHLGLSLHLFTGDKKENTNKIITALGEVGKNVTVKANCSPEQKQQGIMALKADGHLVAMVGDGINDAPALAQADVGMVFSNEEQTASSEAADIIFLDGSVNAVTDIILLARRTIYIARQGILVGIGLSVFAMFLAAFGYIPPLVGSVLQEAIDVAVILNALRASR